MLFGSFKLAAQDRLYLAATLTAFALIWLALPKELGFSDPWWYSRAANGIAKNWDFGGADLDAVFTLRLGVVFPTAIIYKIFGVTIATTTLWPLCAVLLIVFVVWSALPNSRTRRIGLSLCLLCFALWDSSAALYGDIVASAFMAASLLLLIRRETAQPSRLALIAVSSVTLMFFAFLAKETSYWLLPLWALAIFEDRKDRRRLRLFWAPAIAAGTALGLGYLLLCHAIWGDPFIRMKIVNDLTHVHLWDVDKLSHKDFLKRMTTGPIELFAGYFGPIFFLGLGGLLVCPKRDRYWAYYSILCILFYWFGSASPSAYEPLPLVPRMITPVLPALLVLSAHLTARLAVVGREPSGLSRWAPLGVIFLMMSVSLLPIAKSFANPQTQESRAMSRLQEIIGAQPDVQRLLITSDGRSAESLAFHFDYAYPRSLKVVAASKAADETVRAERIYVYVNEASSKFLAETYGEPDRDSVLESLKLPKVFEAAPVTIFEAESAEERQKLRALLSERHAAPLAK